jgi:hypothetical protein
MFNILIFKKKCWTFWEVHGFDRDQHALDFDCWQIDKYPVAWLPHWAERETEFAESEGLRRVDHWYKRFRSAFADHILSTCLQTEFAEPLKFKKILTSITGKSTLACVLSHELHIRGHLTYILDGDNLRHGLSRDLSFKAEDCAENIRSTFSPEISMHLIISILPTEIYYWLLFVLFFSGEVAKLFDAGLICIASLISPYRSDRSTCRSLLPKSSFKEVCMIHFQCSMSSFQVGDLCLLPYGIYSISEFQ